MKRIDGDLVSNIEDHTGDLVVLGNIKNGVSVKILDGNLLVEGNVGDDVTIVQKKTSSRGSNVVINQNGNIFVSSGSGQNITMMNGRVFINGQEIGAGLKSSGTSSVLEHGCQIKGRTGTNVRLTVTDLDANIIGSKNIIKAGSSASIKTLGDLSEVNAGNEITIHGPISQCRLDAGNTVTVGNVQKNSSVNAGNSIDAGDIFDSSVKAGNSIHIGNATASKLRAGNSIHANEILVGCDVQYGNQISSAATRRAGSGR